MKRKAFYRLIALALFLAVLSGFPSSTVAKEKRAEKLVEAAYTEELTDEEADGEASEDIADAVTKTEKEELPESPLKHFDFWLVGCSGQLKAAWKHNDSVDFYRVYLSTDGESFDKHYNVYRDYLIADNLSHRTKYYIRIEAIMYDEEFAEQLYAVTTVQSVRTK